ncbi:MAG: hypothetical protein RLZZ188_1997 [Verrucomicrobiota bacterium]|jgi:hypothetical protein
MPHPNNPDAKKPTKESWLRFKEWKRFIASLPDQNPVLQPSIRSKTHTGVFLYRFSSISYEKMAQEWFAERNVTYRKNFVEYCDQLFSMLISTELEEDHSNTPEQIGKQLHSIDLKQINRNYADFNSALMRKGFLDRLSLHENRGKKPKYIEYAAPRELIRKGVQKAFLLRPERQRLVKSIKVSTKPEQTPKKLDGLMRYYRRQIGRTTILLKDFDGLEVELGHFRELYPKVMRHRQGKLDLKIGPKEGRLYSLYLNAPRVFRRLLRWNGQFMTEGDVAASHFHFLLRELTDPDERQRMIEDLQSPDPYMSMCGRPRDVNRQELKSSSHQFKYGSRLKRYPKMRNSDWLALRRQKRTLLYREGLFFRHLSRRYPKFAAAMADKKIFGRNQKSMFACAIMRRESDVMVRMVGARCMAEKLVYLPIHDGFLTIPKHYDRVCRIVTECFQATTGSIPTIRNKTTIVPAQKKSQKRKKRGS